MIDGNWSELIGIRSALNCAMCKIYRVKFELLDAIYSHTRQSDCRYYNE